MFRRGSNGLNSYPLLAALLLFLAGKEALVKHFLADFLANHERARLNMEKQKEEISEKYDFFDPKDDKKC